ncbi:MAG: prepilin-type N-terminal cleavage/methylation domain-containing protein [Synergistaceae bacterium]|jgi:prepilin-type N-terminal cleavage/methylation domain-containing protein|nr:prepilin-type N-terminal cleavage/methylation domain-containing protein [Synergistaceae bacterium]
MRGFTMIEVLVAVLVLGLVVTASLKLVALSHRGLSEVREKEIFLNSAAKLQIEIAQDPLNLFGANDDVSWNVYDMSSPLWLDETINIDALGFGDNLSKDLAQLRGREQRWRELEVKRNGKNLTLFLPHDPAAVSDDGP